MICSCKVDADDGVKNGRQELLTSSWEKCSWRAKGGKARPKWDLVCHLSSISSSVASESMSAFKDGSALLLGAKSGSSSNRSS
jgi:hypothetical protein